MIKPLLKSILLLLLVVPFAGAKRVSRLETLLRILRSTTLLAKRTRFRAIAVRKLSSSSSSAAAIGDRFAKSSSVSCKSPKTAIENAVAIILGISPYDAAETASWLEEQNWSYPILCDGAPAIDAYGLLNPHVSRESM